MKAIPTKVQALYFRSAMLCFPAPGPARQARPLEIPRLGPLSVEEPSLQHKIAQIAS